MQVHGFSCCGCSSDEVAMLATSRWLSRCGIGDRFYQIGCVLQRGKGGLKGLSWS